MQELRHAPGAALSPFHALSRSSLTIPLESALYRREAEDRRHLMASAVGGVSRAGGSSSLDQSLDTSWLLCLNHIVKVSLRRE